MPDDSILEHGHERNACITTITESIHQPWLILAAERQLIDKANGIDIGGGLGSNCD